MKKERKEDSFIKQPFYKGGDKALKDFVQTHLRYPAQSQANKVEGDVHIRYDINHKGEVTDTKIIGGLDEFCNEEAIRVVKMLKFIVPKTPRHLKVTFHKNIRIHFHIHEMNTEHTQPIHTNEQTTNQNIQISYTVVKNPAMPVTKKENSPFSYNYVVKI
jgi:TonB family protein